MARENDNFSDGVQIASDTAKGAVKGVGYAAAGTAAVAAGGVAAVGAAMAAPAVAAGLLAAAALTGLAIAAASTPIAIVAGLGAAYALTKSVLKIREQKSELRAQERAQREGVNQAMAQAQQQAYAVGVQNGRAEVVNKLQEEMAHAQQVHENSTKFTDMVGGKKGVTPQDIIRNREAAAKTPHSLTA